MRRLGNFTRSVRGSRIVFGAGVRARLAEAVAELGSQRVLVVGTPRRRDDLEAVAQLLGEVAVAIHDRARQHVPEETVKAALEVVARHRADAILAYGGGSAIGLAKAVALEAPVRIIAVATTYSGSEMTHIWGVTRGGAKATGRDERVRPALVMYDPELTLRLPIRVSVPSLFNAMAHAAEALYAEELTADLADEAEEGLHLIARALPKLVEAPRDLAAREAALYGAHLAGACLDAVSMALHHKLAHVLGGNFDLPHAETHTVLLPHVLRYNRNAAPQAMERVARALGVEDAATGVFDLAVRVGAPTRLADLGFERANIRPAAEAATANPYRNPRPVDLDSLCELLTHALEGRRP